MIQIRMSAQLIGKAEIRCHHTIGQRDVVGLQSWQNVIELRLDSFSRLPIQSFVKRLCPVLLRGSCFAPSVVLDDSSLVD